METSHVLFLTTFTYFCGLNFAEMRFKFNTLYYLNLVKHVGVNGTSQRQSLDSLQFRRSSVHFRLRHFQRRTKLPFLCSKM